MTVEVQLNPVEGGGVATPQGFRAAGVYAGFRRNPEKKDLALFVADDVCVAAGVFTQNVFCAAPVQLCRERLGGVGYGTARAIVVNSGNANAATGTTGMDNARETARMAAAVLGCAEEDVLVASTGVIGVQLPLEPFGHLRELACALGSSREDGLSAAQAIMTTDTRVKSLAFSWTSADPVFAGTVFSVGGCCKGSGMIMPNMATMIAVLTTDVPLVGHAAHQALSAAVRESFNMVTVDSDTSTNDTCFLLASGAGAPEARTAGGIAGGVLYDEFCMALRALCTELARMIAADGEGATKLVTVQVRGAATETDADLAARAIANSPLVKTAIAGHDANWGRIAAAAGRSGAVFAQENVDIDIMGMPVLRAGLPTGFSEEEALRRFEQPEISIDVDLGAGPYETRVWTCDFTHDYITINGDYRT